MCLTNSIQHVKKILKRKEKWVKGYKCVRLILSNNDYLSGVYQTKFNYKRGWNISDTPNNSKVCMDNYNLDNDTGTIEHGIHFNYTIVEASTHFYTDEACVIIPVKALRKDLLGANEHDMACKKIFISKTAYNKALKKAKQHFKYLSRN